MSLYAPDGIVFTNQQGSKKLRVSAYDGSTPIVTYDNNGIPTVTGGATFKWYSESGGTWTVISGETSAVLTVNGSDVNGQKSYRCEMTYKGKTYADVITMTDKTDNYQASIDSTAGDIFKNTVGDTCLICRIWQNATEVDMQKSGVYSKTAPASPSTNTYYYQIQASGATTKLMRYNGSAWVDVTADTSLGHEKTYTWYRRDKDGNQLDTTTPFATGKVIHVTGDDVDTKTVFVCEVE